ncbi:uncharacterized protein EV420DRAFT_477306 [Desarmillaria tabescens]|uniref:Uncharacterized protein n=1 Tax=Armillaria tabescens TaxID=1929756 RepID=A0AA39KFE1_ARMTA|nr:uncharacterized protein EV420DRAFT_477306 [Desarmillaria tabescens]KAK0457768.1 hypothetical protein EV420DRAFT_477306 [Desarmillaria tabescens]
MSASADISNFEFKPTDGVPATWTPAHAILVYKSLKADPIRHDTDGWGRAHIRWVTKAIWFCDKIRRLSKVTGTPYHVLANQRVNVIHHLRPLLARHGTPSLQYFAKRSPSFRKQLYGMIGVEWKGLADPPSSSDETSEEEEEEEEEGLSGKSGEDSGDWGSDDDGDDHEEDESEVQEDLMDVDGEDSGSAAGNMNVARAAPVVIKAKRYTKTGWPVSLNQRLRQGKTQPSMRQNMEELEEEGHLEESEWKCDRYRGVGGRLCRVPKDSNNGHPACAECLISSHSGGS